MGHRTAHLTKARYQEIKKTFVEPAAVNRVLAQFDGKLAHGGQEPKAWMPHEETPTADGAKALIVTNMAPQSATGAPKQENVDVEFSRAEIRQLRWRAIRY